MTAGESALRDVCVEAAHFGARDDGVGLVENQRRCLEAVEEAVGAGIHDVLLGVGSASGNSPPAAIFIVGGREQVVTTGGGIGPGRVVVGARVVAERVASLGEIERGKNRERVAEVLVLEVQQLAVFLVGKRESVRVGDGIVRFRVSGGGVRDAEQVVAGRIAEIRHRRSRPAQDQRQAGLERNAGERVGIGQSGLDHGAVQDAVLYQVVVGVARFPIVLRVEMRARLFRITDPMDQREVPGVVHRREEFQRGMERGKPVAEADRVRVAEGRVRGGRADREITGADRRVVGQRIG